MSSTSDRRRSTADSIYDRPLRSFCKSRVWDKVPYGITVILFRKKTLIPLKQCMLSRGKSVCKNHLSVGLSAHRKKSRGETRLC